MSMNDLTARIKGLAGNSTADLVGIAPESAFGAEELGELGERVGRVESVVVLAQRVTDPVQLIRYHCGADYAGSRVRPSFTDAMIRDACWRAVEMLHDAGYRAAIPRNLRYGADEPRHGISYKKAAVLAGFGAIGRSGLLIHPELGPWVTLRVVVTDAALEPDARVEGSPCADCERCIAACPSKALSENGIDRERCDAFMPSSDESGGAVRVSPHGQINCDECLRACPVGVAPPRLGGL